METENSFKVVGVRAPDRVEVRFDCSECGKMLLKLALARMVTEKELAGLVKLARTAHARTHAA